MPSSISEFQEFLQRPLQTLPSCCSAGGPAARELLSHFTPRRSGRAREAEAAGEFLLCSWTRAHSGTCQFGIMVVQSHGICTERHIMQGPHFCNYNYSYYCSTPGVLHFNKAPHCWTLTRNSTCCPLCVDILSQEDWDFTERYSYRQRQKWRLTSFGTDASPKWLQRLPLGHTRILPLENTQLCALNSAQLFQPAFTVHETSSVGTAPEHMLCRTKSNAQVSWEKRTMVHTMQHTEIFPPLYHAVIFTLQRSMELPQMRSEELQMRSHGSFGVMLISWVSSVRWALAVFLR